MPDKYKNKYRIPSARAEWWDYGKNAAYFITICTRERHCFFGEIEDGKMCPNHIGRIAGEIWGLIPQHFPYSGLGEFVVMPNHVHGIIIINKLSPIPDSVETRLIASLPSNPPGGITGNKNPMLQDNVSHIVRWYKGRCSFEMRKIKKDFGWQARFHDHIIRDENSFHRISNYILNNPQRWEIDTFYLK